MTSRDVVVFDYGFGNVRSAVRALERVGAQVTLTSDLDTAMNAAGVVIPGVGAFAACAAGLRAHRGDWLVERRLAGGRPVLGICVGMQVLFDRGVENGQESDGLGQWPGVVDRLDAPVVPHMGWNTVKPAQGSTLFEGIESQRFYFVHSYAARSFPLTDEPGHAAQRKPLVTWATYANNDFVAAVENGPLSATQFHPEKSGDAGAHLLANWVGQLS